MTYQERTIAIQKPPLSEMFAALSGIICAGVTAVKKPDDKTQYLAALGMAAAGLPFEVKLDLASHPGNTEKAARTLMRFLVQAKPLLAHHIGVPLTSAKGAKGSVVADLLAHIKDIERRESLGSMDRLAERFEAGKKHPAYAATYLPVAVKEKSVDLTEENDAPAEPKKRPRGRPRKMAQAEPVLP